LSGSFYKESKRSKTFCSRSSADKTVLADAEKLALRGFTLVEVCTFTGLLLAPWADLASSDVTFPPDFSDTSDILWSLPPTCPALFITPS
jgi:hypothetical protein